MRARVDKEAMAERREGGDGRKERGREGAREEGRKQRRIGPEDK